MGDSFTLEVFVKLRDLLYIRVRPSLRTVHPKAFAHAWASPEQRSGCLTTGFVWLVQAQNQGTQVGLLPPSLFMLQGSVLPANFNLCL